MGVGSEGRKGSVLAFIYMAALGSPFKWSKQRGGLCSEWVGLTTDYRNYSFGISERRSAWLVAWIQEVCRVKLVEPRLFAAALGRLGFAATALPWEKPFLGPLYVWSAAVREQHGKVLVPWAVLMILDWIASRLQEGRRMEEVRVEAPLSSPPMVIYTDARASEVDACLGGYLAVDKDLKKCPWFSVEVDKTLAPWLFSKGGNPKRVIAALELLATVIAVKLWAGRCGCGLVARMKAYTDNKGNSFVLHKGMSTKFPLTLLLMELSEELRERDLGMDLEWVRREENTVADDLSNGKSEAFDVELREKVDASTLEWRVLKELQARGEQLYEEIRSLKLQGKVEGKLPAVGLAKRKKGKILSRW